MVLTVLIGLPHLSVAILTYPFFLCYWLLLTFRDEVFDLYHEFFSVSVDVAAEGLDAGVTLA